MQKTKREHGKNSMRKTVSVCLILCLVLFSFSGCAADPIATSVRGYSIPIDSMNTATKNSIVAQCGDHSLSNEIFQYYYWLEYKNYLNEWGSIIQQYSQFDPYSPLADQIRITDSRTWQEYFIDAAMDTYRQYQSLINAAELDESYIFPQYAQDMVDGIEAELESGRQLMGCETLDELLQSLYFETATLEGFKEYYETYVRANAYRAYLESGIEYTDDTISDYYDARVDTYYGYENIPKDDVKMVNVRQILIYPKTAPDGKTAQMDWDVARQKAQIILDEYLNSGKNPDIFLDLVSKYSEDVSTLSTGGLISGVYPEAFGGEIDTWCFDMEHIPGDAGIVQSDYAWHILYFDSYSDKACWYHVALSDFIQEQMNAYFEAYYTAFPLTLYKENIRLTDVNLPEDQK